MYADDVVLLAESPDELQKMLDMMGQYAEEWKFSFNASKCKTMVVGATSGSEKWRISGEEMEEVKTFNESTWGCGLIGACEGMCSWRR